MPVIIHFIPLQSTKVILLLSYHFFPSEIFLFYSVSIVFLALNCCLFSVLFYSNTCFNVCGSCLQEEEVAESGVSVEVNATGMEVVQLLTQTASFSLMHAHKIACVLLTLSAYIPDKMPLANKVKVVIEPAFFFFVFSIIDVPLSLFQILIQQSQLNDGGDRKYLLCACYVPYTVLSTLYELFNLQTTL